MYNYLKLFGDIALAPEARAREVLALASGCTPDLRGMLYRPLGSTIAEDWRHDPHEIAYVGAGWDNTRNFIAPNTDPVAAQIAQSRHRTHLFRGHSTIFVEEGPGVPRDRFFDDVLGLAPDGRAKNPILALSPLTLVVSRYEELPRMLSFTVVLRLTPPGMDCESYVARVDHRGNVLPMPDDDQANSLFMQAGDVAPGDFPAKSPLQTTGTMFVCF